MPALYAVTYLGDFSASDINEVGQVVGSRTTNSATHAALWEGGRMIDLGTLGGTTSWTTAINDLGQVVGTSYLPGDEIYHAFLVNPQGGEWFQDSDLDGRNDFMIDLGTLDSSYIPVSLAYDINNAGQVVGQTASNGFRWDAANGMTDFPAVSAVGINENGQMTGYSDDGVVVWDPANGMTNLDSGSGYYNHGPSDLNDAGQVAGFAYVYDPFRGEVSRAIVWDTAGSFTDLGVLPNGIDSYAADINNSGQVVGYGLVATSESDAYYRPFLWDATDGMVDLLGQVPGSAANGLMSLDNYAAAINDGGAIVVSVYADSDSVGAYLLTPVPPGTPSISVADAPAVTEGNAGTVSASFTVTLSAASTQTVTVAYTTGNNTATAGSDYESASGTLTFAPGETSKTITVWVTGDRLPELTETFVANLSLPTNALIADGQGVGTITDDEPRISISDVSKLEGKNGKTLFTFTVTLTVSGSSLGYDQAVSMSFRTVNGTAKSGEDYVAKAGTLTFNPGEMTKTITIEVKGDSKKEVNERFYLDLTGISENMLISKSRGIATILNDD